MAKAGRATFDEKAVLAMMESMRRPNGAFMASPPRDPKKEPQSWNDYALLWIRDHLYSTFAYWYLGEYDKLRQGVWLIFDLFQKYEEKIKTRIAAPVVMAAKNGTLHGEYLDLPGALFHAKYDADTLEEITTDTGWGHDQLDSIGLFLHIVADLDFKNIRIIRNEKDIETIELLVYYLRGVEYWHHPDFGMWEECRIRHSSSIGAVVGGLSYIKRRKLTTFTILDPLIKLGQDALNELLPYESRDRCHRPHHNHDCDAAQLYLIWPYNVIVNPAKQDEVLARIINGHDAENGEYHLLLQTHGFNRYWGDDYYRSTEGRYRGVSAEWVKFKFLVSIIYSQRHEYEKAALWFAQGLKEMTDHKVPEARQNGRPNDHTPLAWGQAMALIAWRKLPAEFQKQFLP